MRLACTHWMAIAFLCCLATTPYAAEENQSAVDSGAELERLSEALARIEGLVPLVSELEASYADIAADDVLTRTVTDARLERAWNSFVTEVHGTSRLVLSLEEAGVELAEQRSAVEELLVSVPASAFAIADRLSSEVTLPTQELAAAEQSAVFARASIAVERINGLFDQVLANLALQAEFGLDSSLPAAELTSRLEARAAATSAFLDVSARDVDALSTQASVLPDDTEASARLAVARQRVAFSADALRSLVTQMQSQEMNTSEYEEQLLATTVKLRQTFLTFLFWAGSLLPPGSLSPAGLLKTAPV